MNILTVDTLTDAREKLLDCAGNWEITLEKIHILNCAGQVLAEDIFASENVPPFKRSTVDGYAVTADDTIGADDSMPVFLAVTEPVLMGKSAGSIKAGLCTYVPTGGMLPEGANAVVMVEYSETVDENTVALYDAVSFGENVVQEGEDVQRGDLLLGKGTRIRPQEIGALAAVGITEVLVFRPLGITVISTGDELISPSETPEPGEIRDINTYGIKTLAEQKGYRVMASHVLPDNKELMEETVRKAMAEDCHIIAISGGSSQGKMDLTGEVISAVAKPGVLTHGISIKPGKPTILGWDSAGKTLFVGLPGHPVAAIIVFEMLLSWLMDRLTGAEPRRPVPAKISANLAGSPGRTTYQPVSLKWDEKEYQAIPVFGKSGLITTLTKAEGYVAIDMNKEGLKKGETVLVHLF